MRLTTTILKAQCRWKDHTHPCGHCCLMIPALRTPFPRLRVKHGSTDRKASEPCSHSGVEQLTHRSLFYVDYRYTVRSNVCKAHCASAVLYNYRNSPDLLDLINACQAVPPVGIAIKNVSSCHYTGAEFRPIMKHCQVF